MKIIVKCVLPFLVGTAILYSGQGQPKQQKTDHTCVVLTPWEKQIAEETELYESIQANDLKCVKKALKANINRDFTQFSVKYNFRTYLMHHSGPFYHLIQAVLRDNIEITQELIQQGANVNIKDAEDCTPLHCTNNPQIVTMLLRNGALIAEKNQMLRTPLEELFFNHIHSKTTHDRFNCVLILLKHGAEFSKTIAESIKSCAHMNPKETYALLKLVSLYVFATDFTQKKINYLQSDLSINYWLN